ncbi:MAG: DUF2953 domain-containing protein [Clostridiaceae bacterium]|nr:DUF2953 domain-containing protein [Clostridiaceae bacterium]
MLFLYILVKIILYILLVLLIVLLAVLIIPFKYISSGEKQESTFLEGSVAWLFGGLKMKFIYNSDSGHSMTINFMGFKKNLNNKKEKEQSKAKSENNSYKKEHEKPVYSYFTSEVIKKGIQAFLKVLNHCKPSKFNLEAKAGFDDPMYTGLLYGIQGAGFAILNKYHINLKPSFEEEDLKGSFIIGGSIQIFYLLLVAIEFVITRPFRSILLKNIKIKIKRRLKKWRISILTKT